MQKYVSRDPNHIIMLFMIIFSPVLRQLAFLTARNLYAIELDDDVLDKEELMNILNNSYLSNYFLTLAREVYSLFKIIFILWVLL